MANATRETRSRASAKPPPPAVVECLRGGQKKAAVVVAERRGGGPTMPPVTAATMKRRSMLHLSCSNWPWRANLGGIGNTALASVADGETARREPAQPSRLSGAKSHIDARATVGLVPTRPHHFGMVFLVSYQFWPIPSMLLRWVINSAKLSLSHPLSRIKWINQWAIDQSPLS